MAVAVGGGDDLLREQTFRRHVLLGLELLL
jgi:hypothetical protein